MKAQQRAATIAWRGILIAVEMAAVDEKRARQVAIYLLMTVCNVPGSIAASVAGCTKQNVSKLMRAMEDRRDDPEFDAKLSALEARFLEG